MTPVTMETTLVYLVSRLREMFNNLCSTLSKDVFQRRLEGVERENLNPLVGLRASHEWMGDVSTIPEAGRQSPGSDKTPAQSASQDSAQLDELKGVMSLETALVRALQRLGTIW